MATNSYKYDRESSAQIAPVMSTVDWLISLVILSIPIINLIMMLIWAFGENDNPNRSNFCKASLVIITVCMGLGVLCVIAYD
ncbi:hypothetical protein [Snodgrassella alvi]|jgi:hypothetical protein|uniref:hypothetical protein n=1 Tax=Snodgrassella alvi TaxID=1196083 RepID=UPI000C1E6E7D|nr:hypothetical protein [Snodgrassella alvi]PIT47012.1 hypothetical protein BHC51_06830 [Snodgrassella alvi]